MTVTIRAVVWGENIHEHTNAIVRAIYPDGMHATIAAALNAGQGVEATTATLHEPEHGLTAEKPKSRKVMQDL